MFVICLVAKGPTDIEVRFGVLRAVGDLRQ